MGWRVINGRRYYYGLAGRKAGKRWMYIGPGVRGMQAEDADRAFLERYRALRDEIRVEKEALRRIGQDVSDLMAESQRFVAAVLIADGYYRHCNSWRRRSKEFRLRVCGHDGRD